MSQRDKLQQENGNVLFLILIAVALFAALSYAITQSGRSGGDVDKEKESIKVAGMMEFTSMLKAAVLRMTFTGTAVSSLVFEKPGSEGTGVPCVTGADCVYAAEGGAINWKAPPSDIWSTGAGAIWQYSDLVIKDVGSTAADKITTLGSGAACLKTSVCEQINKGLGITYNPIGEETGFGAVGGFDSYPGEAYACFEPIPGGSGCYWYYHTLVEQ